MPSLRPRPFWSERRVVALLAVIAPAVVLACASDETLGFEDETSVPVPGADGGPSDAQPADGCAGDACAPAVRDCSQLAACLVPGAVDPVIALNAIWGTSRTDVWAVGTHGTILHGDGTTFTRVPFEVDTLLTAVSGTGANDVWIAQSDAPLRVTREADGGVSFELVRGATWDPWFETQGITRALWGASDGSLWMAGPASQRFGGAGSFWRRTMSDAGIGWAVVDAYEGSDGWWALPNIQGLGGSSVDNLWGVGESGAIFRYVSPASPDDAGKWVGYNGQTSSWLAAITATSANDVWAVGDDGTIRHFTNDPTGRFQIVESPTQNHLRGIWAIGSSDIWAVGDLGTVIHYDGKTWSLVEVELPEGRTPDLTAVWASGPEDVWIVGKGVVLHRSKESRRLP